MRAVAMSLFGAAILAGFAGCASTESGRYGGDAAVVGAPAAGPGATVRDCRGGGTYNRAADLCVGGGGP